MRKLASIQVINKLEPIEGADLIEMATVLGWHIVVKKDEFNVGDKVSHVKFGNGVVTNVSKTLTVRASGKLEGLAIGKLNNNESIKILSRTYNKKT